MQVHVSPLLTHIRGRLCGPSLTTPRLALFERTQPMAWHTFFPVSAAMPFRDTPEWPLCWVTNPELLPTVRIAHTIMTLQFNTSLREEASAAKV
jgi:hypothetical protein